MMGGIEREWLKGMRGKGGGRIERIGKREQEKFTRMGGREGERVQRI